METYAFPEGLADFNSGLLSGETDCLSLWIGEKIQWSERNQVDGALT